jgi:hypothetical protein
MLAANANALTASGMLAWSASELRSAGFYQNEEGVSEAAADAVAPLLRAAMITLELSGVTSEDRGAALRDIIADYVSGPAPAQLETSARRVA